MARGEKQDPKPASEPASKYEPPKLTVHGSIEAWTRGKSTTRGESTHKT
jgi:hypothetical protein